jgi:hypothetical protein
VFSGLSGLIAGRAASVSTLADTMAPAVAFWCQRVANWCHANKTRNRAAGFAAGFFPGAAGFIAETLIISKEFSDLLRLAISVQI